MWKEVIREWGREVGEEEREVGEGGGVRQGEVQKWEEREVEREEELTLTNQPIK